MKAKIAELETKHEQLIKEAEALEAEERAAIGADAAAKQADADKKSAGAANLRDAQGDYNAASKTAAAKKAEADKLAAHSADLKAKLAKAEAAAAHGGKNDEQLQKEVVAAKAAYEDANAKYLREAADLKAAEKVAARARAELAKYEERPYSLGSRALPAVFVALLACMGLQ